MELRHLQAFVAVAEELHFGRAADRLRLSPAPVSRAVAELEREIGSALFVRGHHSVTLTSAGAGLLPEAGALLSSWSTFLAHGREFTRAAARPRIALGAPTLAAAEVVDRLLEELAVVRPGIPIDVTLGSSTQLLAELLAGSLDLSIVLLPTDESGVLTLPLARYEMTIAMREDDDLAHRTRLTPDDLSGRRVLMATTSIQQGAVQTIKQWLTDMGAVVELLPDVDLIHVSLLVRRGRGLTLSSTSGAAAQIFSQPGLTSIPLDSPVPGIHLGVATQARSRDHGLWPQLSSRLTEVLRGGLLRT